MNSLAEIEKWLKEHAINNYLISEDFYITVQGNVNLNKKLSVKNYPLNLRW